MNDLSVKKVALFFALFAFTLLCIGSLINGARVTTSIIRGGEGFLIFGLLAWGVGKRLLAKQSADPEPVSPPQDEPVGENLDPTA